MKTLVKRAFCLSLLFCFVLLLNGTYFSELAAQTPHEALVECFNSADINRPATLKKLADNLDAAGIEVEGFTKVAAGVSGWEKALNSPVDAEQVTNAIIKAIEERRAAGTLPAELESLFGDPRMTQACMREIIYEIIAMELLKRFLNKDATPAEYAKFRWSAFVDFLCLLLEQNSRFGLNSAKPANNVVGILRSYRDSYAPTIIVGLPIKLRAVPLPESLRKEVGAHLMQRIREVV